MHTEMMTAQPGSSTNGLSCSPCPELAVATEAELSAFYAAVQSCNDTTTADTAADLWLKIFASTEIDPCSPKRELRKITIAAAAHLADNSLQNGNDFFAAGRRAEF